MGARRRLIFHIGLEKTGTSSVQACLFRNERVLARHGVLYPKRNLAFGWQNHKPLVGCYGIDEVGDRWLAIDPSRHRRVVASLVDEIEASRHGTAVVSAEHFSSRFGARQIRELHADFARFDCSVVIVVRDHFSRLCSAYETYVSNGGPYPIATFAEGLIRPGARDMRYADLIAPWVQTFGRDRVALVPYGSDVLQRVLAHIDPVLAGAAVPPSRRANVSVRPQIVAALRLANEAAAQCKPETIHWVRETRRRAQLETWLCRVASDEPAGAWSFEPELLARMNAIVRADVAALEARYGLAIDAPAYPEQGAGDVDLEGAMLLARALRAQAAKPWSMSSMSGSGLALAADLRDGFRRLQSWLARASRVRRPEQPVA